MALIVFGAALVVAACYSLGRFVFASLELPAAVRFGLGATILSHGLLVLFLFGIGFSKLITAVLLVLVIPLFWVRPSRPPWPAAPNTAVFGPVAAVFGAFYLIHALAPEIQPDAAGYHLGLVREWLIHNGFPPRVGFYETLPQGLEMLFAPAFDIGRHSAAKLVHFAFLAATIPLIAATGRELRLASWQTGAAAVLYACSPVVGIAGTSAYNDAALVFFLLAVFYLLLRWDSDRRWQYAAAAGLAAGFCYSIKITGLIAPALAFLFLLWRRRPRTAVLLAAFAALMVAPWMARNAVWTGNPVAPLFNAVFENPYFHIAAERQLSAILRDYSGVRWHEIPLELTVRGGKLQGLIGPVFLLAPLALLGLRRPAGRILLLAGAAVSIPWFLNHGARFAMPGLVFLAMALAVALPRRPAMALALVHAVLALPPMMSLHAEANAWRLRGLPVAAAVRAEPEAEYLRRTLWEFELAELVDRHVPPAGRVFELFATPSSYHDAAAVGPWHSAAAGRMREALRLGAMTGSGVYSELDARWDEREITALRIRLAESVAPEWSIHEIRLRGPAASAGRGQWTLSAWPNIWEAPLAADGNFITRWAAREEPRPDMYLQLNFGSAERLSGVTVVATSDENQRHIEFLGRLPEGRWVRLASEPNVLLHPAVDLGRSATGVLKSNGIEYILAPVSGSVFAEIGRAMVTDPARWGVEPLGRVRDVYLLRIP